MPIVERGPVWEHERLSEIAGLKTACQCGHPSFDHFLSDGRLVCNHCICGDYLDPDTQTDRCAINIGTAPHHLEGSRGILLVLAAFWNRYYWVIGVIAWAYTFYYIKRWLG